jgi:glycine cleavage system H protein
MKYTDSHEWINVNEGIGTVGVSEHAQKELGDIVYVELPQIGKEVKAGQEAAVLESTKAAADVYSPVSGTIVEVNNALTADPGLINQSPEGDGWIFKLKLSNASELDQLMDKDAYFKKLSKS